MSRKNERRAGYLVAGLVIYLPLAIFAGAIIRGLLYQLGLL